MIWAVLFSPKNQVRAGRIVGSMLAILSFDDLDSRKKKTANTWGELVKIDMERTKCLGKEQNLHGL